MPLDFKNADVSPARQERRSKIVAAAHALVDFEVGENFDAVHAELCPIDVVMVAGAPWLSDGIERDFHKDESGYRKIGGGANTPLVQYFFRSTNNLLHYLKRQGFYVARGDVVAAQSGMAVFFDWDDRGRFNFAPDRSGIIIEASAHEIREVVMAVPKPDRKSPAEFVVKLVYVRPGDDFDRAIIGYSDLP